MAIAITIVSTTFQIYSFLILLRVLLSWLNTNPYQPTVAHPLLRVLYQLTDPVLVPLQRIVPPIGGTLDISPIIALIVLEIARRILISVLSGF